MAQKYGIDGFTTPINKFKDDKIMLPHGLSHMHTTLENFVALSNRTIRGFQLMTLIFVGVLKGVTMPPMVLDNFEEDIRNKIEKGEKLDRMEELALIRYYANYHDFAAKEAFGWLEDKRFAGPISGTAFRLFMSTRLSGYPAEHSVNVFLDYSGCPIDTYLENAGDIKQVKNLRYVVLPSVGGTYPLNQPNENDVFVGVATNLEKELIWMVGPIPADYSSKGRAISAHDGHLLYWKKLAQKLADETNSIVGFHCGPHAILDAKGKAHIHFHKYNSFPVFRYNGKLYSEAYIAQMAYAFETIKKRQNLLHGAYSGVDRLCDMQILCFPMKREPEWYDQCKGIMAALAVSTPSGWSYPVMETKAMFAQYEKLLGFANTFRSLDFTHFNDMIVHIDDGYVPLPFTLTGGNNFDAGYSVKESPLALKSAPPSQHTPGQLAGTIILCKRSEFPTETGSYPLVKIDQIDFYPFSCKAGRTKTSHEFRALNVFSHTLRDAATSQVRNYFSSHTQRGLGPTSSVKEVDILMTLPILPDFVPNIVYLGAQNTQLLVFPLKKTEDGEKVEDIDPATATFAMFQDTYDIPEWYEPLIAFKLWKALRLKGITQIGREAYKHNTYHGDYQDFTRSGPGFDVVLCDIDQADIYPAGMVNEQTWPEVKRKATTKLDELLTWIKAKGTANVRGYLKLNLWLTEFEAVLEKANMHVIGVLPGRRGIAALEVYLVFDRSAPFSGAKSINALVRQATSVSRGLVSGKPKLDSTHWTAQYFVSSTDFQVYGDAVTSALFSQSRWPHMFTTNTETEGVIVACRPDAFSEQYCVRRQCFGSRSITRLHGSSAFIYQPNFKLKPFIDARTAGKVFQLTLLRMVRDHYRNLFTTPDRVLDLGGGPYVGATLIANPFDNILLLDLCNPIAQLDKGVDAINMDVLRFIQDPLVNYQGRVAVCTFAWGAITTHHSQYNPIELLINLVQKLIHLGYSGLYIQLNFVPHQGNTAFIEELPQRSPIFPRFSEVGGSYPAEIHTNNWNFGAEHVRLTPTLEQYAQTTVENGYVPNSNYFSDFWHYIDTWQLYYVSLTPSRSGSSISSRDSSY